MTSRLLLSAVMACVGVVTLTDDAEAGRRRGRRACCFQGHHMHHGHHLHQGWGGYHHQSFGGCPTGACASTIDVQPGYAQMESYGAESYALTPAPQQSHSVGYAPSSSCQPNPISGPIPEGQHQLHHQQHNMQHQQHLQQQQGWQQQPMQQGYGQQQFAPGVQQQNAGRLNYGADAQGATNDQHILQGDQKAINDVGGRDTSR